MEEERAAWAGARMKAIRARCRKVLDRVAEPFSGDTAAQVEELSLSAPVVEALMDLVLDFQAAFSREKARRGLLDFSDLEHFAVRLLTGEEGEPSELARYCAARYDEVLVDEYQDTNQVQNAIFDAISGGGRHLFQVGDVKQSIYRFRLADPTIFLEKYSRCPGGGCCPGISAPGRRCWRGATTCSGVLCQLTSASWTTTTARSWFRERRFCRRNPVGAAYGRPMRMRKDKSGRPQAAPTEETTPMP